MFRIYEAHQELVHLFEHFAVALPTNVKNVLIFKSILEMVTTIMWNFANMSYFTPWHRVYMIKDIENLCGIRAKGIWFLWMGWIDAWGTNILQTLTSSCEWDEFNYINFGDNIASNVVDLCSRYNAFVYCVLCKCHKYELEVCGDDCFCCDVVCSLFWCVLQRCGRICGKAFRNGKKDDDLWFCIFYKVKW